MAVNYDLNNTGPEVQARLDQVLPNKSEINELERRVDAHDTEIADRYTKEEVNALVSPEAPTITVATRAELDEITEHPNGAVYRVANYDGTQVVSNKYAEYGWDGTQYILLDVKDVGIDTTVTEGSDNLPTSGAVYNFRDPVPISDVDDDSDLRLSDQAGHDLAIFKDGEVITKGFDSKKTPAVRGSHTSKDLVISDKDGNAIVVIDDGHVITKGFDSRGSFPQIAESYVDKDLILTDKNGNTLLVLSDGHIATKNFNSAAEQTGFSKNDWGGKSICFLGDSVIQHGYVINAVAQFLGCKVINKGWSGAMITPTKSLQGNSTWYSSGNKAYAFTKRFNSDRSPNNRDDGNHKHWGMPSADIVDLLVIHGGGNDYGHGDGATNRDVIKLGNANEPMSNDLVDNPIGGTLVNAGSSFAAALKYTCYRARLYYPHIPIALCTIFSSYTHYESNRTHYHSQGEFSNSTYTDYTDKHTDPVRDPVTHEIIVPPEPIGVEGVPTMEVTPKTKDLADVTGATKEDFNRIIRDVAKQFGFYVIEMANYSGCGINDEFANLNFIDGDMVHPSDPYGAWNYGAFMAKEILNKIPYVDKALADREQGGEHTEP